MKDALGDRMKRDYESRTHVLLPRRTYTHKRTGEEPSALALRSAWVMVEPPVFTRDRAWLQERVPRSRP